MGGWSRYWPVLCSSKLTLSKKKEEQFRSDVNISFFVYTKLLELIFEM